LKNVRLVNITEINQRNNQAAKQPNQKTRTTNQTSELANKPTTGQTSEKRQLTKQSTERVNQVI
jgi:hypothetical protein